MVNYLREIWNGLFGHAPKMQADAHPDEVNAALMLFIKVFHNLGTNDNLWSSRAPVKTRQNFSGYGYVEGQNLAIKINRRLHVVGADDDLGYTSMCAVLDDEPCLMLIHASDFSIRVINSQPNEQSVFPCNDYVEYTQLPEYLRNIMQDIIVHVYRAVVKQREENARERQRVATAMKEYK